MELNRKQTIEDFERLVERFGENGSYNRYITASNTLALIKELTEENEMLRAENKNKCKDCAGCLQWKCDCANIRDEAITEFAEKLKYTLCINNEDNTEFFDYAYTLETIDQTAKEVSEENNVQVTD